MQTEQAAWDLLMQNILISENGCWLLTDKYSTKKGYGQICVYGRQIATHKLAYLMAYGNPGNKHVLHSCDNKNCINPAHLHLGSNRENIQEKVSRGRSLIGSRHHQAILTEQQVQEIIEQKDVMGIELAAKYGVSKQMISRIRKGKAWNHVTGLAQPKTSNTRKEVYKKTLSPALYKILFS